MNTVEARLRGLRIWFILGFIFELVVGTVVAVEVIGLIRQSGPYGHALRPAPAGLVVGSSLMTGIVLLALALVVFHGLLRLRNWARILLLVLGWLGAVEATVSLLSAPSLVLMRGWLADVLPGVDLRWLAGASLLSNFIKLAVWGYVIAVLQFDREVRAAFLRVSAPPAQPTA